MYLREHENSSFVSLVMFDHVPVDGVLTDASASASPSNFPQVDVAWSAPVLGRSSPGFPPRTREVAFLWGLLRFLLDGSRASLAASRFFAALFSASLLGLVICPARVSRLFTVAAAEVSKVRSFPRWVRCFALFCLMF